MISSNAKADGTMRTLASSATSRIRMQGMKRRITISLSNCQPTINMIQIEYVTARIYVTAATGDEDVTRDCCGGGHDAGRASGRRPAAGGPATGHPGQRHAADRLPHRFEAVFLPRPGGTAHRLYDRALRARCQVAAARARLVGSRYPLGAGRYPHAVRGHRRWQRRHG